MLYCTVNNNFSHAQGDRAAQSSMNVNKQINK